jgi:hypothetical protein
MYVFSPPHGSLMTDADQILKRNLYFIVSQTAPGKNGALNQVCSDTASFSSAGFGRIGHLRHYWLVWGHVQWANTTRLRCSLVL